MNRIFLLFAFVLMSGSALAAPISCNDDVWHVSVSSNHESATLYRDGEVVQFGDLRCIDIFTAVYREEGVPLLSCYSKYVADAGYNVYIYQPHRSWKILGTLSEMSFIGEKKIAYLKCVAAVH